MGNARWDPDAWKSYAAATAGRATEELFTANQIAPGLDPFGLDVRLSCDSPLNPQSTAVIVGLDVTGSMGQLADVMVRRGLGVLVEEILARRPVPDPHILLAAIGDATCDAAPLQVSQFEAGTEPMTDQLRQIWIEHGGGGNGTESYHLPWYFAARHTRTDCWEQRHKKGYLFTVGDEQPPRRLRVAEVERVIGDTLARDLSTRQVLEMAEAQWEVFHIIVEEGGHARRRRRETFADWRALLGERVIPLADHRRLAEVVVSAIQRNEGADPEAIAATWPAATARVVQRALCLDAL